jgi:hypothetical protein
LDIKKRLSSIIVEISELKSGFQIRICFTLKDTHVRMAANMGTFAGKIRFHPTGMSKRPLERLTGQEPVVD